MKLSLAFPAALIVALAANAAYKVGLAEAGTFIIPPSSFDTIVGSSFSIGGGPDHTGYYLNDPDARIGSVNTPQALLRQQKVFGFELPVLDGATITFAEIVLHTAQLNNDDRPFNLDLYGLLTTNPDVTGIGLFFQGADDPTQPKLADDFVVGGGFGPSAGPHSADVTAFIAGLYAGTSPLQSEVFFRLNPNTAFSVAPPNVNQFIIADFLQHGGLLITTIPEPNGAMLLLISVAMFGTGALGRISAWSA